MYGIAPTAGIVAQHSRRLSDRYFVRVDAHREWPFLITKLSPYNER